MIIFAGRTTQVVLNFTASAPRHVTRNARPSHLQSKGRVFKFVPVSAWLALGSPVRPSRRLPYQFSSLKHSGLQVMHLLSTTLEIGAHQPVLQSAASLFSAKQAEAQTSFLVSKMYANANSWSPTQSIKRCIQNSKNQ